MAELKVSNEEKLNKFMQDNHLDTLNYKAIALMLMKQQEQIDEIAKNIPVMSPIGTDDLNIKTLFDKWNNK